ncbi:MAG: hypothetical protein M2R45_03432 [Verrucomicrobia subdivision 3 bacterium]|nr:hypothetical protein [Limisphaerales bacterium]MCS1416336.1 hypothetical protein [Limisphaerales bacterium]
MKAAAAEKARIEHWKANFPWKPVTDPEVVITQEILDSPSAHPVVVENHGFLKDFFENDLRFTPQFEQLYRLLEEHGRGNNLVEAGNIFRNLWEYHRLMGILQEDPEAVSQVV